MALLYFLWFIMAAVIVYGVCCGIASMTNALLSWHARRVAVKRATPSPALEDLLRRNDQREAVKRAEHDNHIAGHDSPPDDACQFCASERAARRVRASEERQFIERTTIMEAAHCKDCNGLRNLENEETIYAYGYPLASLRKRPNVMCDKHVNILHDRLEELNLELELGKDR